MLGIVKEQKASSGAGESEEKWSVANGLREVGRQALASSVGHNMELG